MKKFRFILVLAMAVVISGGVISTSRVVNAATDINFGSRTVDVHEDGFRKVKQDIH